MYVYNYIYIERESGVFQKFVCHLVSAINCLVGGLEHQTFNNGETCDVSIFVLTPSGSH